MQPQIPHKLLITGGAGFIGSALIRHLIHITDCHVINVDKLTYAGNPESLSDALHSSRHTLEQVDVCDQEALYRLFQTYRPDAVMHLAAESHVDRSIYGPADFIQTNVVGTTNLLEGARSYWNSLEGEKKAAFRFHHVSTDEVYGDLTPQDPAFTETHPYAPSSPYSASKAASDHMVRAWHRTYGLPVLVTNCSNNYGPYQFPEKLIPLMILNAVEGKTLPVYGQGENIRDWLHVEDHARALWHVLIHGQVGQTYNIGGRAERTNLEVVHKICDILDELAPHFSLSSSGKEERWKSHADLITFVKDRPGHDQRYAIDDTRLATELDWRPKESFDTGLRKTIAWYLDNPEWIQRVRSGEYRQWVEINYAQREASTP